jgi:hypothetical protein
LDEPVPELYVTLDEYHPGIVELSVQAMPVPVEARVSKFSVRGDSNVVMLPLFVRAEEGEVMKEKTITEKANAHKANSSRRE